MSGRDANIREGSRRLDEYWTRQMEDPAFRAAYEAEAPKMELWLALVEARQDAGLTREQMAERLGVSVRRVSQIENHGYDACTLATLRRYVQALGVGLMLQVSVQAAPADRHGERLDSLAPAASDK